MLAPWKESYDQPRQYIQKQRHYFIDLSPNSKSYDFSNSHVWMWKLAHTEGWEPKNWCFWAVVLEKTLESPLDSKEIKLVNPKGNQLWIFTGRTVAEAEAPILGHLMQRWFIGKDCDAGEDEGRRRRGQQRMKWLGSITDSVNINLSKLWETVANRGDRHVIVHGVAEWDMT